ncbi:hypothetical protein Tco_1280267 [Tanacetum coccineum]
MIRYHLRLIMEYLMRRDILFFEKLLNDDPTKDLPPKELKNDETKMTKSSIEDPPKLELKDLPPHLELVPPCFAIFTFEPLTLSLTSMPSCDLESLTNILILCLILKASNQSLRKSLSLNLELS